MAKFIKFVNEEMNNNGFKFDEGLNEAPIPMTDGQCESGGIEFTDTNWFALWVVGNSKLVNNKYEYTPTYWVFDVEIPDGEPFIAFDNKYRAQRVILSNPRKLWKIAPNVINRGYVTFDEIYSYYLNNINTEFYGMFKNGMDRMENDPMDPYIDRRKFIAKKDSSHQLVSTDIIRREY